MRKRIWRLGAWLGLAWFLFHRSLSLPYRWVRGTYWPRKFSDPTPELQRLLIACTRRGWGNIAWNKGGYAYRDVWAEFRRADRDSWQILISDVNRPKIEMPERLEALPDSSRYKQILLGR